ncbi:MAG: DUF3048 domain-containing protein [Roseburia sp.]|nr:DUF3048 domain-containing protein [Roseburia sp.]
MKKWKICLILLASAGVMASCGKPLGLPGSPVIVDEADIPSEGAIDDAASVSADIPQRIVIEDDTLPPQEGMVRSRLTNEWVDASVAAMRPIAVMTPNESAAQPQYNLSKASVIYEANVEWQMTRMMAIYENWKDIDTLGNIRSLRSYFAYWAFEWDAFIVHFGGPFFIDELLAQPTTQNINGIVKEAPAFFRSPEKKAPHNAYATGDGLYKAITDKDYEPAYRGLADEEHFRFTPKAEPNTLEQYGTGARNAAYIDMTSCYPLTRCYFEFNEEDGLYYRYQYLTGSVDGPHVDASGEQLCFKNILVQNTKYEELGEGYLAFQCHDSTRDGWYFTNGKGIHINWEKTSDYGATRYYDDNGDEITLNTGKTMICIVEDGDDFTFR